MLYIYIAVTNSKRTVHRSDTHLLSTFLMMKLKREMNNQYLLNSTVAYANNIQTGTYTLNKISKSRKNSKIILVYEFSTINYYFTFFCSKCLFVY